MQFYPQIKSRVLKGSEKSETLKIPRILRAFHILIPKDTIFGLFLFLERKKVRKYYVRLTVLALRSIVVSRRTVRQC